MEAQGDGLSYNHGQGCGTTARKGQDAPYSSNQGSLDLQDSGDHQLHNNQNQNQNYSGEGRHNVPNIILTGEIQLPLERYCMYFNKGSTLMVTPAHAPKHPQMRDDRGDGFIWNQG